MGRGRARARREDVEQKNGEMMGRAVDSDIIGYVCVSISIYIYIHNFSIILYSIWHIYIYTQQNHSWVCPKMVERSTSREFWLFQTYLFCPKTPNDSPMEHPRWTNHRTVCGPRSIATKVDYQRVDCIELHWWWFGEIPVEITNFGWFNSSITIFHNCCWWIPHVSPLFAGKS